MRFDVYCDESRPDLLASKKSPAKYLVIGGLWLPTAKREEFKKQIHSLRDKHKIGGEFKWRKVSPSKLDFYMELFEWFISQAEELRFRCIVVDAQKVNLVKFHESDQELGFYKFYYHMLRHWILDFNQYAVFCDFKSNRKSNRLDTLKKCLHFSNLSSSISTVQSVRSEESVLIQLVDVLVGACSAKFNQIGTPGGAKEKLIQNLELQLGKQLGPTYRSEQKLNVFLINLEGGW